MSHWSTRSLAQVAMQRGVVPQIADSTVALIADSTVALIADSTVALIADSTVALILKQAELQPHRSGYWKTPTLNADFVGRASQILWCYEGVRALAAKGEWVVCFDEMPNLQALERCRAKQPMQRGQIERQEFEYIRHGTVNFAAALLVHNGLMRGWCLDKNKNDNEHLLPALEEMLAEFSEARRIHLIRDGGPSHMAHNTQAWLGRQKRVRVLCTPAHASWLNPGELLLRAFSELYLKRGEWVSRQHLSTHLDGSWREYNHLFAHPFTWSWTRHDMRKWVARCIK